MSCREPRQDVVEVLVVRGVGTDPGGENRHEDDDARDDDTGDERGTAPSAVPETVSPRQRVLGVIQDIGKWRRRTHRSRIRGSRRAATRSVARLIKTTLVPSTMVTACTTGKSRLRIELNSNDPSPLRLKTCSTMT